MLFLLISRLLIWIFLLLSIIIIFYILFGKRILISRRFCHLCWPWPLGFLLFFLNSFCSFANTRAFVWLSIWIISWSWFTLNMQPRGHNLFCAPYLFILGYTLIFTSHNFVSLSMFGFLDCFGIEWYVCISAFWSTQPFTVDEIMPFFKQDHYFCASGHATCVIHSDMLNAYHYPAHYCFLYIFPFQLYISCLSCRSLVPLQFPLPDMVITMGFYTWLLGLLFLGFWVTFIL